jgi:putative transposase
MKTRIIEHVEARRMPRKRQHYTAEFKFRVALEAIKGQKTVNEIASEHGVHPNRVSEWKQALLKDGASLFARADGGHKERALEAQEAELYEQIGRLKMELEWLTK